MEVIRLSESTFTTAVQKARDVLAKGGVVLYPTDTLYGLAVDALSVPALERLRLLKGREKKKPMSIVVKDVASIEKYAQLDGLAKKYAERFLPGPLTLVLPGDPHLPKDLVLHGQVGIRVPNDAFALSLAKSYSRPFTATSANRSGMSTASTIPDILERLGVHVASIDLAIDAGERVGGVGSTVLTFRDGVPQILREGALSKTDLDIFG